jgi:hypothetical protein
VPANAVCQAISMPQTHRYRGQGRGERCSAPRFIGMRRSNCRSARARERGVSADVNATNPPPSRASALLHRCAAADISKQDTGFAADAISKPYTKPVGAGLLANSACQATSIPQTHPNLRQARPYSRNASSAPVECGSGGVQRSLGMLHPYLTRRVAPEDLLMLTFNKLFLALAFLGSSAAAQAADGNADVSRTDYGKNTERPDRINGLRRSLATSAQVGSWSQAFSQQPADNAYVAGYESFTAHVNGVRLQPVSLSAYTVPMPQTSTTRLSSANVNANTSPRTLHQSPSLSLSESPHTYLPVHHIL